MKRRQFVSQGTKIGFASFFAIHLLSCNGDPKKIKETLEKSVSPQFNFNNADGYTIRPLNHNIWTFEERGGTIAFAIENEGMAIIDTQFPDQSEHLMDALREQTEIPLSYLINTHHHADHTAGNIYFKDITKKHIAHQNSLKNQSRSAEERGTLDQQLFPSETFEKEWTGAFGNDTIRMKYYGAAHTDGDAVTTFINSNIVHMGDLVFNRRFPYIDMSAGADVENWIQVLDNVVKDHNNETKYIFGHSDNGFDILGNEEDLNAFKNYLEKLLEYGQAAKKSGKSLDELIAETTSIPGAEEWQGKGVERSLKAIYSE